MSVESVNEKNQFSGSLSFRSIEVISLKLLVKSLNSNSKCAPIQIIKYKKLTMKSLFYLIYGSAFMTVLEIDTRIGSRI